MDKVIEWAQIEPGCRRIEISFGVPYDLVNDDLPTWNAKVYSVFENGMPRKAIGSAMARTMVEAVNQAWRNYHLP